MLETTHLLVKPDGVLRGLKHASQALRDAGIEVRHFSRIRLTETKVRILYPERMDDCFKQDVIDYMTSGQCVLLEVEGEDVISRVKEVKGKTGKSGLRLRFAQNFIHNTFHCPDTREEVIRERGIFK